jgi:FkbM family methyltransferase
MSSELELQTLWAAEKYVKQVTSLMGAEMRLLDGPSFVSQYRQIVVGEAYSFEFENDRPTIIDGGANIGVSALWWLDKWPNAKLVALEPDPNVFEVLEWNLRHHPHVDLRPVALAPSPGFQDFHPEGSDGGSLHTPKESETNLISVPTIALSELIDELGTVDLLKLDIEGTELEVLLQAEARLSNVERIFVEYHSFSEEKQKLSQLIALLERTGFRYYLQDEQKKNKPFETAGSNSGMDLQLDIWAYRERR